MADALTTITSLIQSPPGQLAAGGVLGGLVSRFFKNVGDILNEKTTKEIARWIRVRNLETGIVADEAVNWPQTFAKWFDEYFGTKHPSWKGFWRSVMATMVVALIAAMVTIGFNKDCGCGLRYAVAYYFIAPALANVVPDYLSFLETRFMLSLLRPNGSILLWVVILAVDLCVTAYIAVVTTGFWWYWWGIFTNEGRDFAPIELLDPFAAADFVAFLFHYGMWAFVFPAFFTSALLWLYVGSGFIIKAAQRLDISFGWFISKADIEKKPLQSIGLVAGALVAIAYWAAVVVSRVVG